MTELCQAFKSVQYGIENGEYEQPANVEDIKVNLNELIISRSRLEEKLKNLYYVSSRQ